MEDVLLPADDAGAASSSGTRAAMESERVSLRPTVVAIGASAGGLEPLETFFSNLPTDTGMAFVVMQHLSPDFRSMMGEILARHTAMEITQARDGIEVRPNVIYLNPPRSYLRLDGEVIRVSDVGDPLGNVATIDILFQSVATERGPDAIGIILSGSGSDGSRGSESISSAGGTVIVQDPETAKFDGMPCAAIARGAARFIASPERIRTILVRIAAGETPEAINGDRPVETDPKTMILAQLRDRFGSDFGLYKNATIGRRIDRRISMKGYPDIASYAASLQTDPDELDALYHDILIGVTSFFRDREAFDFLRENVIPHIVDNQRHGEFIRVWVAGCATGEEAYSLAMLFDDYAERSGQRLSLKILATDVHKRSLEIATRGSYPKQQIKNVEKAFLDKYFEQTGDSYVALPRIRKYIVFSCHDLTSNPPFTRIDLVSCRNLLIYLNQPTQQKVLSFIHFALRKDGYLLLGPSEAIGRLADEFLTLSETWRIFQKLRDVRLIDHSMPTIFNRPEEQLALPGTAATVADPLGRKTVRPRDLQDAYDALLKRYAPAGFLVTTAGQLVRVFGEADRYIDVTQGAFSANLVDLVVADLRLTIASGLEQMRRTPEEGYGRLVNLRQADGRVATIDLRIEQLPTADHGPQFQVITIREVVAPTAVSPVRPVSGAAYEQGDILSSRIRELERELATREAGLQGLVEEFETSNEELQATNEELMASNEELQSTNEELHSVNEELYTVSAEHQRKIEQLIQLTSDMEHLLRSTNIGTMFVDRSCCIRSFTPMATRAFNLIEQDIGRPLSHITARFELPDWAGLIARVIEEGDSFEREIRCDGQHFLLRVLPYRVRHGGSDGAVITLIDIDELHRANTRLEESEARFRSFYRLTPAKLNSFDRSGRITEVSDHWLEQLGYSRDEVIGRDLASMMKADIREAFAREVLPRFWRQRTLAGEPCIMLTRAGVEIEVEMSAVIADTRDDANALCVLVDVTDRNNVRRTLELRNRELERSNDALGQYANMASHDLQEPLRKIKSYCGILANELGNEVSEDARYAMNVLSEAAERLSVLVASLLQFSRVSSNPLKMSMVPLGTVVTAALSHLELEIKDSGATIDVGELPTVLADRTLVERVFQNLIGNAMKYRRKDAHPAIAIRMQSTKDEILITVVDDGIGFDQRFATVIFEPLKRLHGVSEYPGAGIGLAITKAIIDRHGWRISAESAPGAGSTFTIAIPQEASRRRRNGG